MAFWGVISYMIGILGELMKFIRKQNEEILANQRRMKPADNQRPES